MLSVIVNGIVYKDNTVKWEDIPEPIERMEYQATATQIIVMRGFNSYLRIKEFVKGVNCHLDGMSKIFMFGRALGKTGVVEINLQTLKVKNYIVKQGEEYYGRLCAEKEWKRGVAGKSEIFVKDIELD